MISGPSPTVPKEHALPNEAKKILVAPAWPYASGPRHLGHVAGFAVPSDVFARYHRLKGNDVLMVSGTDEHGTPVMVAADREGQSRRVRSPTATTSSSARTSASSGISYDLLHAHDDAQPRARHAGPLQDALRARRDRRADDARSRSPPTTGHTLPDRYIEGTCPICGYPEARGDQCDNCGNQLDPTDLINPRSKIDGSTPEFRETKHLFLDLPAFAEQLEAVDRRRRTDWRPNVQNFSLGLVRRAEAARRSRATSTGACRIPVPGYAEDENKRIYVWFDAVIGYLSASDRVGARPRRRPTPGASGGRTPTREHYYFQGKDNIVFHTVIWPAMLLGYGEGGELGAGTRRPRTCRRTSSRASS